MRRRFGTLLTVLTFVLSTLAGGCTRHSREREAARHLALPDVSRLATSVQAQLRERHSALMAKLGYRTTPAEELDDAYGELGLILMAAEYYEAAASCFLTAQALVPDDARWPYYLGHLYRIKGEAEKAAEFFSRALELQPAHAPTLIWLGEMYLDRGRSDQAEALFLQALSRDPGSAAALSGAGRAALAKHDLPRAI